MTARLPKSTARDSESTPHISFYTFYKPMNELLNEFVQAAESEGIWTSVEVHELIEEPPDARSCEIIRLALETAKTNCIESSPPRNRFVKVRCRNTQNKNFVKILYSCENCEPRMFNRYIAVISEAVEQAGGYLKTEVNKDTGIIKIALPSRIHPNNQPRD